MSNRTTPSTPGSAGRSPTPSGGTGHGPSGQPAIPHEKIAMRAYEKWCQRGCPQGTDQQDWHEAEAELRSEMTGQSPTGGRSPSTPAMPSSAARPSQPMPPMPQKPARR